MTVNTKKLVVTEAAVMQHVTAIEGIITPMDLLEAITGEFLHHDSEDEPKVMVREDGSECG